MIKIKNKKADGKFLMNKKAESKFLMNKKAESKFLMNKKATMLLTTFFKVLIAIACIILLGILLFKLYGLFLKDSEAEQARQTLRQLADKINSLEEGEMKDYLYVAPKGWALVSDDKELYLCPEDNFGVNRATDTMNEKNEIIQNCFDTGIFEEFKFNVEVIPKCEYVIDNCLYFDKIPVLLSLKKENEKIIIGSMAQVSGESSFDSILNLKGNSGKTIKQLTIDYTVSESDKIKEEIGNALKDYFSKIDTQKEYGIKREDFFWEYILFKEVEPVRGSGIALTIIFTLKSHPDVTYFVSKASFSKYSYFEKNGEKFIIKLEFYDKTKDLNIK